MRRSAVTLAWTLVVGATIPSAAFADHGENFHCSRFPFSSKAAKAAMSRLAHNNAMERIIAFYALDWENEEMRRICEAGSKGKTVDTGCLEGKRDWDAIAAKIPKGLGGKDSSALRPLMLELDQRGYHTTERADVIKLCARLGVIAPAFK